MSKFTDAIKAGLKAYFQTDDIPTEAQFAEWIDAIQNGIQEHEHLAAGGAGTGTGDAAQVGAYSLLIPGQDYGDLLAYGPGYWARLALGATGLRGQDLGHLARLH